MASYIISYTQLKTLVITKKLNWQYIESDNGYDLLASDGIVVWTTVVYKDGGADVTDFETNYKALANTETLSGRSSAIPDRPSQRAGRVQRQGSLDHQTGNQTLYTVTVGKVLYVTDVVLTVYNTSIAAAGRLQIRDNTAVVIPVSMPPAGLATTAASSQPTALVATFTEPKKFLTNVNVNIASGTITYSLSLTGYEE